ncbi:PaRep2b protein [Pyrobaculum arsenaticum]|uniref:PaRep2b protein n=1 Tax=Pyrobaculum arsenaticum TaxID=121277 RepID=A0A7L4PBV4_9CREN|nr:PaRep2b protein [Pyrobaculum arsenaticum]NYR15346.1 PaRep2b protein [Pyrobaculum arsenaticum]
MARRSARRTSRWSTSCAARPARSSGWRRGLETRGGDEIARIVIKWDGEGLRAVFNGDKEKAERLASILNALGADVKLREHGGE